MIKVENLTKKYGNFVALEDVSFNISERQIVGLLGPNGAGKTTTLKILTCYFKPNSGQVEIDGLNVWDNSLEIKRKIGYLPETNPLYTDMRVKEYLQYAAAMQDIPRDEIKKAVEKVIVTCGLQEKQNQEISKLSKGFRQRTGLAAALIANPEILILDEPTEGLDPNQRIEIRNLIKSIGAEKTVIISSHVLSEVEATCDRLLIIDKGKIIADGTPAELKEKMSGKNIITLQVIGPEIEIKEKLKEIDGISQILSSASKDGVLQIEIETVADDKGLKNKIVQVLIANNWELQSIKAQEITLEDIFVKLTHK